MNRICAINGLDSGGQGWFTVIMQSQPLNLGEQPKTSNGNPPRPDTFGERVWMPEIVRVPTGEMVPGENGELVPQERGYISGQEHVRYFEPVRPPKEGYAYFIGPEDGLIKIGFSTVPNRRLRDLQLACPVPLKLLALAPGTVALEQEYHTRFAEHRQHGEWFTPCQAIRSEIRRLNKMTPTPTTAQRSV